MIHTQRMRLFALLLGLFLLVGQFASLAHATAHPFHVSDSYCASLSSLQHTSSALLSASAPVLLLQFISSDVISTETPTPASSTRNYYQSRAPPLV